MHMRATFFSLQNSMRRLIIRYFLLLTSWNGPVHHDNVVRWKKETQNDGELHETRMMLVL